MRTMRLVIRLFTQDLRLRDNPALDTALRQACAVVPLFVLEDRLVTGPRAAPNRIRFLLEALQDLRSSLRERGGDLILRRGDAVTDVIKLARETGARGGVLRRQRQRLRRSPAALPHQGVPGGQAGAGPCARRVTVITAGDPRPSGGSDHFKAFTLVLAAWENAPRRAGPGVPARVHLPSGLTAGRLPEPRSLTGAPSPGQQLECGRRTVAGWNVSGHECRGM